MFSLRLALRYARLRPARTLVTILGIAVGVAGLRAIELGTRGALDSVKVAFEQAAGPAALVVTPAGDAAAPLPPGIFAKLDGRADLEAVLPLVQVPTVRTEELNAWAAPLYPGEVTGVLVVGVDYGREAGRGRFRVSQGGAAEGGAIFAGERWAQDRGLKPGDTLRLVAGEGELKLKLAGYVTREGLGAKNYGQVVVAPIDLVRQSFGLAADEVNEAALVVKDARLDAVADRLRKELGTGVSVLRPAERGKDVALRLGNIRAGTDLTSSLALFISAFLIFGLYTTAAAERRRDTGMLRCVGATRRQAMAPLLLEAVLCAVPGALLGAVTGAWLASGVAATFSRVAGAEVHLPPADLAGAVRAGLIGLGVALASAVWPAVRASREAPFEAVRARSSASERPPLWAMLAWLGVALVAVVMLVKDPPRTHSTGRTYVLGLLLIAGCTGLMPGIIGRFVGWLTAPTARLFGGGAALGVAGARWRPVRSGLAAGAVLSAVAMVGGISSVGLGVRQQMGDWADKALGWDLFVRRPSGMDQAAMEKIRALPGVLRISPITVRPGEIVTQDERRLSLSVVGVSPDAYAEDGAFTFTAETPGKPADLVRSLNEPGKAFVTAVLAQQLGVRTGE
ncbi:MAG TPA: FtsX-like permease family protein, partial [Longimicrobium sp.]|nr:FtsX-like permease family protein [Longimicrobium sp.]